MARRDYICCKSCGNKLVYDGYDNIRESLDFNYGTVDLICPSCLDALEVKLAKLEQATAVEPAHKYTSVYAGNVVGIYKDGEQMTIEQIVSDLNTKAVEPAQAVPVAWKHDCAALLTNGVELWIDACPHCGKPRTPAVEPAQAARSGSCSNLMWATAKMREREHNRIGKMVGVLEQIKQEKLSALESAQAVPQHVIEASNRIPQNIIETPQAMPVATVVVEPDYWSGGHFHKGSRPYITYSDIAKLPIGTKLCICPPPAIDEAQQRALDFVRWIASLKTGGLIQARANDILKLLEAGNE